MTRHFCALGAAFLACLIVLARPAIVLAHGYTVGDLQIGHPWTRTTPPGAKVAGGYLTITNSGTMPDRLLTATFARSSATEVHEMAVDNGIMKMRELPKGLEIPPGRTVTLAPGGFHLMFLGLSNRLGEGESIKGTLVFERAGRIEVDFKVEPMGFKASGEHDHQHHNNGKAKTP